MERVRGQIVGWLARSPARNLLAGVAGGAATGAVEYIAHTTVMQADLPRNLPGIVDAGIIAAVTAVLIYFLLKHWRMRRALVLQQLHTVAELNHHVRNALEAIMYSQFLPQQEQTRAVLESVDRIENTLHDLFPAIGAEEYENFPVAGRRPNTPPEGARD